MDINATLFGQMITFALFVLFTMKFVWPPVMQVLEERREKIAEGLAAAERGQLELSQAKEKSEAVLGEARQEAQTIVSKAREQADKMVADAVLKAEEEAARVAASADAALLQKEQSARRALEAELAGLVVLGAEKILQREVDPAAHQDIFDSLIKEI